MVGKIYVDDVIMFLGEEYGDLIGVVCVNVFCVGVVVLVLWFLLVIVLVLLVSGSVFVDIVIFFLKFVVLIFGGVYVVFVWVV